MSRGHAAFQAKAEWGAGARGRGHLPGQCFAAGTVHADRATPQQLADKRSRLSAWTTGAGVLQLEVVQRAANVSWVRHKHCTGRQQQHSLLPCRAGAQPTGTNTSRDRAFGPSEWEQTIIQTRKQRDLSTICPTSQPCSSASPPAAAAQPWEGRPAARRVCKGRRLGEERKMQSHSKTPPKPAAFISPLWTGQ